jgi:DNA-binding protein H-NS
MIEELEAQRLEIERKIAEAKTEAHKQAIDAVKALMTATGVTLADLGHRRGSNGGAGKARGKVAVKYRNDKGDTWTGRGRQPVWLRNLLATGHILDHFRV